MKGTTQEETKTVPMTLELAGEINTLMLKKGMGNPQDRLKFFNYALDGKEKSVGFAEAFIKDFEKKYADWEKQTNQ